MPNPPSLYFSSLAYNQDPVHDSPLLDDSLALWVNIQFTRNMVASTITYESLAHYLDYELPQQQHLIPETKALPDDEEEEKRKRNTAASARFRIRKKEKEQRMEKAVQDMTNKSKGLEKRVHELESEIAYLKGLLLIEKDSIATVEQS